MPTPMPTKVDVENLQNENHETCMSIESHVDYVSIGLIMHVLKY